MARYRKSRRRHSFTAKRRSARRPTRRYSAKSGKFKRVRKGGFKRRSGSFKRSAGASSSGGGMKKSTMIIAGLAIGGGILWMVQKRAAANQAAQAQAVAAARTNSGAPFPTASTAMAPAAPAPGANFLSPIMDLFKPIAPNSPVPG